MPAEQRRRRGCAAPSVPRRAEAADAPLASRAARRRRRARRSGSAATTSCAIRMPGSTTNGLARVGVEQVDQQLAAVARVDETRRVDDRDPVLRGEARARLHEAGVALRDRDGEARRRRARARRARARRARRRRGRGRRRRRRRAPAATASARSRRIGSSIRRSPAARCRRSAIRNGAKRGSSRRGRRAIDEHAVRRVLALLDRRAERVELGEPAALLVRHEQPDASRSGSSKRSAMRAFSSSRPSPVTAETCGASGKRFARRRRPSGSTRSILFSTSCDRQLARADLAAARRRPRRRCASELVVRRRGVDDVEHDVGDERLLERRREALDELVRQPADEADRVGDEVAAAVVLEAARRRVERLEEPVLDRHLGAGERVQERRLADVRVARRARSSASRVRRALLAARRALPLEILRAAA